jgi:hypothetical protein
MEWDVLKFAVVLQVTYTDIEETVYFGLYSAKIKAFM